jgi:hypothetical protein
MCARLHQLSKVSLEERGSGQPQGRRTLYLGIASEKIGMDPVNREETTEKIQLDVEHISQQLVLHRA